MNPYFIFFSCLFVLTNSYSQNNSISGKVLSNGEALPFANVYLKNSNLGASSDENGFYKIKNIPKRKFTIVISSLGYQKKISADKL